MSTTQVHIAGWSSWGDLILLVNNKRYTYYGVELPLRDMIERYAKRGQIGTIFKLLERHSRPELAGKE